MTSSAAPQSWLTTPEEDEALNQFRQKNPDLFQKDEKLLFTHLAIVSGLLIFFTLTVVLTPSIFLKIILGIVNAFLWFCLINTTIHHHHTHKNAAKSEIAKKVLNFIYMISMPNAPKRLNRYTRAHLNHHARPFDETDVDHHYGTQRYLKMKQNPKQLFLYYLELTVIGGHVPGWEDDRYMNQVPLENWNQKDYERVKDYERRDALKTAAIQWGAFLAALFVGNWLPFLSAIAWGWAFPMLMVKNWAHFLGQFQHYDARFLEPGSSIWKRTKTYHVPSWLNYLAGGEISGHFLHHLYPEIPYYKVEQARQRLIADPSLAPFAIY